MANEFKVASKLVVTSQQPILLPKRAADPVSGMAAGDFYYNTTDNAIRYYNGSSWDAVASGVVSLTGQALGENEIIIGNASNLSESVDTSASGHILASTSGGLSIKNSVIVDAQISGSAAISRSKIAAGSANRLVYNDIDGKLADLAAITANRALISDANGLPIASSVTATELGYLSGVTSAIQTQLDDKISIAEFKADGGVEVYSADGVAKLAGATKIIFNSGSTATTLKITNDPFDNEIGTMGTVYNQTDAVITVTNSTDVTIATIPARHTMELVLTSQSPEVWTFHAHMIRYADGYNAASRKIVNLLNPTAAQDAATKNYVDSSITAASGANKTLSNLTAPTAINQNLLPDTAGTRDLGAMGSKWNYLYTGYISGDNASLTLEAPPTHNIGFTVGGTILQLTSTAINANTKIDMSNFKITNLGTPTAAQDAATKNYVDLGLANYLPLSGGTMTGNINMGGNKITSLDSPTSALDAVNKAYVDALVAGLDFQKDVFDVQVDSSLVPSLTLGARYIVTNVSSLNAGFGTISGVANNDIVEYNGSNFVVAYDVSVQGEGALVWNRASDYFMFYDGTSWSEFGGLAGVTAGIGLIKTGNTISVNLGAGIKELPTDEVGIDLYASSGMMLTVDGTTESTNAAAQLSLKLDGLTLSKSVDGVKVADGGISDAQVASDAAIQLSKLEALTANRALTSDASGEIVASTVTATELGYLSGVTSAIQSQLNNKAHVSLNNLSNTAVNADIKPATDDTVSLGAVDKNFSGVHAKGLFLGESAVTPAEPESALFLNASETTLVSEKSLAIRTKDNNSGDSEDIVISTGAATGAKGDVRVEAGNLILDTVSGIALQNPDANVRSQTSVASHTLSASTSTFTVISSSLNVSRSSFKSGELHYEVVDSVTDEVRKGRIEFAAGPSSAGFSDTFTSSSSALDTAIEFEVTVSAGVVQFKYKNTSSNNCSFRVTRTVMSASAL